MIDIKLVLSSDISLTDQSYTEKKLSWFKLNKPENQLIDFASFVRDLDGDTITYTEFPTIEVKSGDLWLNKTAEYRNYLVWDVKTGILTFKPEWIASAGNIELILRIGFAATSLGISGVQTELKHSVVFSIEKDVPWQPPEYNLIGEMLIGWNKGPQKPISIVVATLGEDFIQTSEGRIPFVREGESVSKVELVSPLSSWVRLDWDSNTHQGKLIATRPLAQGESPQIVLKVYDYLAPDGVVPAELTIKTLSPVSVSPPVNPNLVIDVNKDVEIDFKAYVSVLDKKILSELKYKLSFELMKNGVPVKFGPSTSFEKDGLFFANGVLTGRLMNDYPGQQLSFCLEVDYDFDGNTYTFEPKAPDGSAVGIPAVVDNNKAPELNKNHEFYIDAQDYINIDNNIGRYPVNLKGLFKDPEGKPVTYRLEPNYDYYDYKVNKLAGYLEIINLADGSAYLQVKNYSADPEIKVSLPEDILGEFKFKISADDGYNESRTDSFLGYDNDFKFVINLSKNKAPELQDVSAINTVELKLGDVVQQSYNINQIYRDPELKGNLTVKNLKVMWGSTDVTNETNNWLAVSVVDDVLKISTKQPITKTELYKKLTVVAEIADVDGLVTKFTKTYEIENLPPIAVPGKPLFPISVYGDIKVIDLKEYFMDPELPNERSFLKFALLHTVAEVSPEIL